MKKIFLTIAAVICMVSIWSTTVVQAFEIVTREMMQEEIVTETDLVRAVDNFIILFDTSGSSDRKVPGKEVSKIKASKELLKLRNEWLPELGYQAGLYIYTDNKTLAGTFKEVYPMAPYNRAQFGAAIDSLPETGKGPTALQQGLHSLRKVLEGLSGKTAVIIFTDGTATISDIPKSPLQIAKSIAKEHDVCFYLISGATEKTNHALLEAASKVNSCSRVVPINFFMDNPLYMGGALFTVKTTSYARLRPITKIVGAVAEDMYFDFDSSDIRSEYNEKLDMLGAYLKENPKAHVAVAGFTDNSGPEEYNLVLSEKRAESVKSYLVDNFGIDAGRIITLWYGPLNPVADNGTSEGRQMNRRVELAVGGVN